MKPKYLVVSGWDYPGQGCTVHGGIPAHIKRGSTYPSKRAAIAACDNIELSYYVLARVKGGWRYVSSTQHGITYEIIKNGIKQI